MSDNPTLSAPLNFSNLAPPESAGMTAEGVQALVELFERQVVTERLHPAAQLVVLRRGRPVVDRAIGRARRAPVTPETPFLTFSATKAFTGMCVHKLIEEGKVEWDAPVAEYWPAFGQKGKQAASVRHVFLHQAGVPARGLFRQAPLWPSWKLSTWHVARLPAEFEPGAKTAYHLVNYGFILGEIVRRVAGMPFEDYLRQTFLTPLGMEHTWLPIPRRELRRSPRLYAARGDWFNSLAALGFDLPPIRRAVMPAATLHSTARDLAVFYQMLLNGGAYAGRRYLQPETIQAATALGYEGWDAVAEGRVRWAHGFHLGGLEPPPGQAGPTMGLGCSARTFGHFGMATSMAWADPDAGLVVAFTCNRMLPVPASRRRWTALSDAVWRGLEGFEG